MFCMQLAERSLQLRARLPPHLIQAEYGSSEHLNKTDSELLAQAIAEMVSE